MLAPNRRQRPRRGVAAVEFAVVAPVLFTLMLGVWEIGRLIQVTMIVQNATREGARIAAQGQIINITGAYTQVQVNSGSPNVFDTVKDYLLAAGFSNTTSLSVNFQYIDGDTTLTQPYQGAKGQRFRVTTTIPFSDFEWSALNIVGVTNVTASVDWVSVRDDPFVVDTSIPTGY